MPRKFMLNDDWRITLTSCEAETENDADVFGFDFLRELKCRLLPSRSPIFQCHPGRAERAMFENVDRAGSEVKGAAQSPKRHTAEWNCSTLRRLQ